MPKLRAATRIMLLAVTLAEELLRFAWLRVRRGRSLTLADRAQWMSAGCAHILRRLGLTLTQQGAAPREGLIVSNHLSHLDILFYSAARPCIFLSKSEVNRWPIIGLLGRCGGTLFMERDRAASAVQAVARVRQALEAGLAVLVFPEATSTDGALVMPFRPMLFQAAIEAGAPVTAAAIGYTAEGAEEQELCYFGDRSFGPHFSHCLGLRDLTASIAWPACSLRFEDRKSAAAECHAAVSAARSAFARQQTRCSPSEELVLLGG